MDDFQRMQRQLIAAASSYLVSEDIGPFRLFINPDDDSPHANYAMPLSGTLPAALSLPLGRVEQGFRARQRQPRWEYLDDAAPALGVALRQRGYRQEMQTLLMRCHPNEITLGPATSTVVVQRLSADSPLEHYQAFRRVQWEAFGAHGSAPSLASAAQFRDRFAALRCYLAWQEDEAVGAGSLTPPHTGVAELAGIATVPRWERRGIGTAVAARIMQEAFADGIELLFLTAANADAGRIYARLGFKACGHGVAYLLDR